MSVAPATLRTYLAALAFAAEPGEFLELRYRLPSGGMGQHFERAQRSAALASRALILSRTTDLYVGCAARRCRAGDRDAVSASAVLWADCDTPEAVAALSAFSPPPSILIASGSGSNRHAYWPLDRRVDPHALELANRRIAHALGSDAGAVTGAAAILRPPGTRNHKHTPPAPVEVIALDAQSRYSLDAVTASLPELDIAAMTARHQRNDRGNDPLRQIPPPAYVEKLTGTAVTRSGWARCPFHDDSGRPNLRAFPAAEQGWCCFSSKCAQPDGRPRGGSIYDFAAPILGYALCGSDFLKLRDHLATLFGVSRP